VRAKNETSHNLLVISLGQNRIYVDGNLYGKYLLLSGFRNTEMNSKVFELNNLLSELNDQGGYFINFITAKGIQASYGYILVKMIRKNRIQLMRYIMLLRAMALSN